MVFRYGQISLLFFLLLSPLAVAEQSVAPEGWSSHSPREEIRPDFRARVVNQNGASATLLVIEADHRTGLSGAWSIEKVTEGGSCKPIVTTDGGTFSSMFR